MTQRTDCNPSSPFGVVGLVGNDQIWRGQMKSTRVPDAQQAAHLSSDDASRSPLAGELMDLYIAALIVIPLAFLLKSLWPS